jgi:hypothetical protein
MKQILIFLLLAGMAGALLWYYRRQHAQVRLERRRLLDACRDLLQDSVLSAGAAGYARLQGRYRNYRMDMRLVEDHLTMRKIPSLWLHLTVEGEPLAASGTLGVLVRPQNTEFYSPCWDWDVAVQPLPGWPEHALYRSQSVAPDLDRADPHVRKFFQDDKAKELVMTPTQVRLTYQARQAERGDYLLLRAVSFDHTPLPPDSVLPLLQRAVELRQAMEKEITP